MSSSDPWALSECNGNILNCTEEKDLLNEFEDDFVSQVAPLPDSEKYLKSLEDKLSKLKRNSSILQQLSDKREESLRNLLNDKISSFKDDEINLDAPFSNGNSTVQEIYRHIAPVQPISVGELVNIVKFDQLEDKSITDSQVVEDNQHKS